MNIKKVRDKKLIAEVYSFLKYKSLTESGLIKEIIKEIQKVPTGSNGFKNIKELKEHLSLSILSKKKLGNTVLRFNEAAILQIINDGVKKCNKVLPSESKNILVFPCFNSFVINNMSGVTGFTPCKNTFHLFIHPSAKWKNTLGKEVGHEFNHSVFMDYHNVNCHEIDTLLNIIIFEGLAENFVERVFEKPNIWAKAVSLKKCNEVLPKIKKLLNSRNQRVYYSLFFEGKKYPLWAGYAIGYQIVKSFLRNNKTIEWKDILRIKPEIIFKESNF